jgi:hypothetical protein
MHTKKDPLPDHEKHSGEADKLKNILKKPRKLILFFVS